MLKMLSSEISKAVILMLLCMMMLVLALSCASPDITPIKNDKNDDINEETAVEETKAPENEGSVDEVPEPAEGPSEAELYTEYLKNGGYDTILEEYYYDATSNLQIRSCLIDMDDDGIKELYIEFVDEESGGVRGPARLFWFLDIKDSVVHPVLNAFYGGGSMGGDELTVLYDNQSKKTVPALTGLFRDGAWANSAYTIIYSTQNYEEELRFSIDNLEPTYYGEEIAKIMSETDLYTEEDGMLEYYKKNDSYISHSDYTALDERFSPYLTEEMIYNGSFDAPVKPE